jgi:hypothetical protein
MIINWQPYLLSQITSKVIQTIVRFIMIKITHTMVKVFLNTLEK